MKSESTSRIPAFLLLATLAILLSVAPLFAATGKLSGLVTSGDSPAPVEGATVVIGENLHSAKSGKDGKYIIVGVVPGTYSVKVSHPYYNPQTFTGVVIHSDLTAVLNVKLWKNVIAMPENEVSYTAPMVQMDVTAKASNLSKLKAVKTGDVLSAQNGFKVNSEGRFHVRGGRDNSVAIILDGEDRRDPNIIPPRPGDPVPTDWNTEEYHRIYENEFLEVTKNPLSTFSIDVDQASYANARRYLMSNQLPPPDAVRIEEFINYFDFDYPDPTGEHPFSITTELGACPWAVDHQLLHVGLQGKLLKTDKLPPSSITFLIDVSGSMQPANKLPLLKAAFRMMIEQLRPEDHVAIVVYAGSEGLALPSTPGNRKQDILAAIDVLGAGGSTAGGAGMIFAYKTAKDNFLKGGNNRVVWATDGDFNTGVSSTADMVRMMEENRKSGVFVTMLGFGEGNLKDGRMEQMADQGNGQYFYIDSIIEARRVMVEQIGGTLVTIAKDVKLQIEFNPAKVSAYRLIGYENRLLKAEDFHDDAKDAGEIGAGHSVTAIYELIPFGVKADLPRVDDLKYQASGIDSKAFKTDEVLTLKLRYKDPDKDVSKLLEQPLSGTPIAFAKSSDNFRFSAAVASFGMLMRDSKFSGSATLIDASRWATGARGDDPGGYRAEFIRLVDIAGLLKKPPRAEFEPMEFDE